MTPKSVVKTVEVMAHCHSPLHQPKNGVSFSGSSGIKWTFKGVYLAKNQCVVVVQAGSDRDAKSCAVSQVGTGGVFPEGQGGAFCELTLAGDNMDEWSISVATEKDATEKKELIFQGGSGK